MFQARVGPGPWALARARKRIVTESVSGLIMGLNVFVKYRFLYLDASTHHAVYVVYVHVHILQVQVMGSYFCIVRNRRTGQRYRFTFPLLIDCKRFARDQSRQGHFVIGHAKAFDFCFICVFAVKASLYRRIVFLHVATSSQSLALKRSHDSR